MSCEAEVLLHVDEAGTELLCAICFRFFLLLFCYCEEAVAMCKEWLSCARSYGKERQQAVGG